MNDNIIKNSVVICGTLASKPSFSHFARGENFFTFPLSTERLSGVHDIINITARESLLENCDIDEATHIYVKGELRSFNNKNGAGAKLVISVFAHELALVDAEDENYVKLYGTICKEPVPRKTPMGREICDIMLAVSRHYGRSDYLPCIVWGTQARKVADCEVGTKLSLHGRIQSRQYIKIIDGEAHEKTAYEVSVIEVDEDVEGK